MPVHDLGVTIMLLIAVAIHEELVFRGLLLLAQQQYADAETVLSGVATKRPTDAGVLNLLAVAIYSQARYSEAVGLLTRANELDADNSTIESNLAKAQSARAAELLAENAEEVRAAPVR